MIGFFQALVLMASLALYGLSLLNRAIKRAVESAWQSR
jgi:hypothetical protein